MSGLECFALSSWTSAPEVFIDPLVGECGAGQPQDAVPPAWVPYTVYEDFPADTFAVPDELAWDHANTDYLFVPWPKNDADGMIPVPEGAPDPGLEFIPLPAPEFFEVNPSGAATDINPFFHLPSGITLPVSVPAFFHPEGAFFMVFSPDTDPPAPEPAWAGGVGAGWTDTSKEETGNDATGGNDEGGAPPPLMMMQVGEAWSESYEGGQSAWTDGMSSNWHLL